MSPLTDNLLLIKKGTASIKESGGLSLQKKILSVKAEYVCVWERQTTEICPHLWLKIIYVFCLYIRHSQRQKKPSSLPRTVVRNDFLNYSPQKSFNISELHSTLMFTSRPVFIKIWQMKKRSKRCVVQCRFLYFFCFTYQILCSCGSESIHTWRQNVTRGRQSEPVG